MGGFRVAINTFQQTNSHIQFQCVFSADIKEDAIKTYNVNFQEEMGKTDIYNLTELPEFDMLCAGFPCQPFSSAGSKKGFDDSRGGMIFKIAEICKKYKPRYLLLENVSNLITLENGSVIKRIEELFENLGYQITYKKINSADFGIPQNRERVYIIGDLYKKHNLDGLSKCDKVFVKDIIDYEAKYSDIPHSLSENLITLHNKKSLHGVRLQDKRGGEQNIHSWDINYHGVISTHEQELMNKLMTERRKKHWAEKKGIKWMDGMPLTLNEIKSFFPHDNVEQMLENLVQKKYLAIEKPKDLVNGKRQYKEDADEGYNICKGKLSFPISKILDPNDVSPTLTATDSCKLAIMIDDKYIRRLTCLELKRLCGFPEDFIVPSDVNKYDLFGNMVTPPTITAILKIIFHF